MRNPAYEKLDTSSCGDLYVLPIRHNAIDHSQ